jgi:hypothetical protein
LKRVVQSLECSGIDNTPCDGIGRNVSVHRFEEIINGREYHIDVALVGDKWRAQIARRLGGSGALMPFYGSTPDEAAQHLVRWLVLAHGQTTHPTSRL